MSDARVLWLMWCIAAAGCSAPVGPTPVPAPGPPASIAWQGTLSRPGETAAVSMSVQEQPLGPSTILVQGTFTAAYPAIRYAGTVGGVIEGGRWSGSLLPTASRPCATPLTTADGTTVLVLALSGGRMTGEATLVECEGRTTWTADFVRD